MMSLSVELERVTIYKRSRPGSATAGAQLAGGGGCRGLTGLAAAPAATPPLAPSSLGSHWAAVAVSAICHIRKACQVYKLRHLSR
jgi:hypothetical protein